MEVVYVKVGQLKAYEKNPRNNKDAVNYVANSIKEFGFKVPIIIDADYTIVAGHTRLLASKKLGLKEVPCIVANDLTPEQIKAYRLADNRVSEFASWDDALLNEELNGIFGLDMADFGFSLMGEDDDEEFSSEYTTKINVPIYEITGECPLVSELVDTEKSEALAVKVHGMELPSDLKEFLLDACKRFDKFNFQNIAEYYAHADKPVQEIFEELALVIVDFDKAIENGFVKLSTRLDTILGESYE